MSERRSCLRLTSTNQAYLWFHSELKWLYVPEWKWVVLQSALPESILTFPIKDLKDLSHAEARYNSEGRFVTVRILQN